MFFLFGLMIRIDILYFYHKECESHISIHIPVTIFSDYWLLVIIKDNKIHRLSYYMNCKTIMKFKIEIEKKRYYINEETLDSIDIK